MQIGDGFEMLWLEKIGPQNEQLVFALLRFFFLNGRISTHRVDVSCRAAVTVVLCERKHLVGHGLHGFPGNSGAGWVIDTAWPITVCLGVDYIVSLT